MGKSSEIQPAPQQKPLSNRIWLIKTTALTIFLVFLTALVTHMIPDFSSLLSPLLPTTNYSPIITDKQDQLLLLGQPTAEIQRQLSFRLAHEFQYEQKLPPHSPHEPTRPVFGRRDVSEEESRLWTAGMLQSFGDDDDKLREAFLQSASSLTKDSGWLGVKARPTRQRRLVVPNRMEALYEPIAERLEALASQQFESGDDEQNWIPDHRDKGTVVALAVMAANAYTLPDKPDWIDVGAAYGVNVSFGWEGDGLRGWVFLSADQSVAVIAMKGTSPVIPGRGSPSAARDQLNDNMMFSCCCARITPWWKPVCGCYSGDNPDTAQPRCSESCLRESVNFKESYYNAARMIFRQVRLIYPRAQIWFTGHSLGGALSSMMTLTTGYPSVTFQAPGDAMYASRLGFNLQAVASQARNNRYSLLDRLPVFHFGNTADPIFTGQCRGWRSACYIGGYAMESKCHLAHQCIYQMRPGLNIRYHRIVDVLRDIILPSEGLPECLAVKYPPSKSAIARKDDGHGEDDDDICQDCGWWEFNE